MVLLGLVIGACSSGLDEVQFGTIEDSNEHGDEPEPSLTDSSPVSRETSPVPSAVAPAANPADPPADDPVMAPAVPGSPDDVPEPADLPSPDANGGAGGEMPAAGGGSGTEVPSGGSEGDPPPSSDGCPTKPFSTEWDDAVVRHADLAQGADLAFDLAPWLQGVGDDDLPVSSQDIPMGWLVVHHRVTPAVSVRLHAETNEPEQVDMGEYPFSVQVQDRGGCILGQIEVRLRVVE